VSSDLAFSVPKRRKKPMTFTIEGDEHEYTFKAPKQAGVFMGLFDGDDEVDEMAMSRAVFEWLDKGLSEDDQKHIEDRLRDEDDDLDFDTLGDIVKALMEKSAGRPPTSRAG
jgi:hypothetical protein